MYQHQWWSGGAIGLPAGKAVCVGRNYAEHAKELNNPLPVRPLLFLKPATAFAPLSPQFSIPPDRGECHHELEVALLIGKPLKNADEAAVRDAVTGIGLCLDLTLRDRQAELKAAGHPWEEAKAFDGALPVSPFVPVSEFADWTTLRFSLQINGQLRQQGDMRDMLNPALPLVAAMSRIFTLQPGDVICTGTPAGVAALHVGDSLQLELDGRYPFQTRVA